jgi:hypothetical protein
MKAYTWWKMVLRKFILSLFTYLSRRNCLLGQGNYSVFKKERKSCGWLFNMLFTLCVEVTCCTYIYCPYVVQYCIYGLSISFSHLQLRAKFLLTEQQCSFEIFVWFLSAAITYQHLFSPDLMYICFLQALAYCSVWFSYTINIFAKDFAFLNYFAHTFWTYDDVSYIVSS